MIHLTVLTPHTNTLYPLYHSQFKYQQLEDYQTKMKDLRNEISTSRQDYNQLKAKNDRTTEALQIAGSNAANARAEADASNARAESLSGQLNDLQSVIEETKRGMEVVRSEHDEGSLSVWCLYICLYCFDCKCVQSQSPHTFNPSTFL